MTMSKFSIILLAILSFVHCNLFAAGGQDNDMQIKVRAGYSIGGTAPISIPATIRSVDKFRLTPSFLVGIDATWPVASVWGITTGLHFENKAMDTEVTTKGYRMELVKGDSKMNGLFTGHVKQEVTQWALTLPLQATYTPKSRLQFRAGPYASLLLSHNFSGIASDGYLRQGDPTGAKIIIGNKEGEWATYDFTDEMRHLQLGIGAGLDWQLHQCIGISVDLNWGITGLFKHEFKTVEQTLYPIYGSISAFYKLK